MPKMFVRSTKGTFTAEARTAAAAALTELGMRCERLADTEEVRAGVWVTFDEIDADAVFSGGTVAKGPQLILVVYALEGGLDDDARTRLIAEATSILGTHAGLAEPVPAYVTIQETPERDWGMAGKQASLAALRTG